jgi:hypothetical protein
MVCFDSCVEFFFQPKRESGYFNLEINCGGTFLCYYIEDPRWTASGFAKYTPVSKEHARLLKIDPSLPATVYPERAESIKWQLGLRIPAEFVEAYVGPQDKAKIWQGNFFKCADKSSHPHWGCWAPLGEALNFHQPAFFKPILFE